MTNLAKSTPKIVEELYLELNRSVLTSYLHGVSGPEGNPGGIERCSPPELLGPCNETCADAYYAAHGFTAEDMFSLAAGLAFQGSAASCNMTLLKGVCFHQGKVLKKLNITDPDVCCSTCAANAQCTHWTLNMDESDKYCHIKGGPVPKQTLDDGCVSGSKTPPPPLPCASGGANPLCGVPGCGS